MILFTILSLIAIFLLVVVVFGISIFGASAIIVFGDVIVCIGAIVWIMKTIIKKR